MTTTSIRTCSELLILQIYQFLEAKHQQIRRFTRLNDLLEKPRLIFLVAKVRRGRGTGIPSHHKRRYLPKRTVFDLAVFQLGFYNQISMQSVLHLVAHCPPSQSSSKAPSQNLTALSAPSDATRRTPSFQRLLRSTVMLSIGPP